MQMWENEKKGIVHIGIESFQEICSKMRNRKRKRKRKKWPLIIIYVKVDTKGSGEVPFPRNRLF